MILSVIVFVGCTNSNKEEELAREVAMREEMVRQNTIDSMEMVNMESKQTYVNSSSSTTSNSAANDNTSTKPEAKKGMSNKKKGALIGAGVGVVGGAVTGAAVSEKKGKGAVVGGVIGGVVGTGVGYGVGAHKDKKDTIK